MKQLAMGIDLGTSNSCVAIVEDGVPKIVANEWGERVHASVVTFLDDGAVVVGNDAKKQIITHPRGTIYSSKRLIGRYYFSEEVKKAQTMCSYDIVEGPNNSVRCKVGDKVHSLPEVAAMILKEMRAIVEAHVGHAVTQAVITVPAFFNDNQRQETKNAGRIAGLEVLRILNEPTAAALAYGFGQNVNQRVVVYDLGGGTFDVSILQIGEDVFEVLATNGDTYLGGDDFDQRIIEWVAASFLKSDGIDINNDRLALAKVKDAAEQAKIGLSEKDKVSIQIQQLAADDQGDPHDLDLVLTRSVFNQMVMDLVQRTFKVCDEALQSARITADEIDGVILVGGPTRLPLIRNSVRHYFQREPNIDVDPDLVVALGAAIQADALLDQNTNTFLLDVTPQTLRLGTVGGFTEPIIEKNTSIPIDRTRTFVTARDNQEKVKIRIFQGEGRKEEECQLLSEFEFGGLRAAARGLVKIEVTFDIDANGIVNVSARDVETGVKSSTSITLSGGMSEAEIEAAAQRNATTDLRQGGHG
jgi:molecular chaperone DnaK